MTPSFLPTHSRAFRRILATGCALFIGVAPVVAADGSSAADNGATPPFHAPIDLLGNAPPMMQSGSSPSSAGGSFLAQSSPNSLLNIPSGPATTQPNVQTSIDEIMKGTMTSPSTKTTPPILGPNQMQPIALPELPPEITD
ncbi:MAG: hypothetical protein ACREJM_04515, partial [Candidatus Saccharimonadales bacterium]